jgi:hypothetical protein
MVVILCLVLTSTRVYAQTELYQLSNGEYSIGIGLRFPEDMTGLDGTLNYAISNNIIGFLGAGLLFVDEKPDLTGVSTTPMEVFRTGAITSDKLGRTELDYWANLGFRLEFEKLVDDSTDATILTSREMTLSAGVGLMKEIMLDSGIALVPLAGVSNAQAWTATELEITGSTKRERENTWYGQMGLVVRVSPAINIGGKVVFSFEESDISYHLSMVLRP